MDLIKIKHNINLNDFFDIAHKALSSLIKANTEMNQELPSNVTFSEIDVKNKSISILIENQLMSTPSIEIILELYHEHIEGAIGYYRLILDNEKNPIDDFFVLNEQH